jgi:hypothetical protein
MLMKTFTGVLEQIIGVIEGSIGEFQYRVADCNWIVVIRAS